MNMSFHESEIALPTAEDVLKYGNRNNWHLNLPAGPYEKMGHNRFTTRFLNWTDRLVMDTFPRGKDIDGYSALKLFGTYKHFFDQIDFLLEMHHIEKPFIETLFSKYPDPVSPDIIHAVTHKVYEAMIELGYTKKDLEI